MLIVPVGNCTVCTFIITLGGLLVEIFLLTVRDKLTLFQRRLEKLMFEQAPSLSVELTLKLLATEHCISLGMIN